MLDARVLATVGLTGVIGFALVAAALTVHQWPFLRDRGWDPVRANDVPYPSILALSRVGIVQVGNFILLGVGLLATAVGLWQTVEPAPAVPALLLGAAGLAALAATAPTDGSVSAIQTRAGAVHAGAFFVLLITTVLAALLFGLSASDAPAWADLAAPSIGAAIALATLTVASFASTRFGGLASLLLEITMLGWVALVALRLATAG